MSKISRALERVYNNDINIPTKTLSLSRDTKIILFSDHHKGAKNSADNFRKSHQTYKIALDYYLRNMYTLIIIGDAEELWQESPSSVIEVYHDLLQLEAKFAEDNRYIRIWGNHDIDWRSNSLTKKYFSQITGFDNIKFIEGVRINIVEKKKILGEIFITHGHQGTLWNDRLIPLSRTLVEYIYRPFQRLTKFNRNTPATNFDLRKKHDLEMYKWAESKENLHLITGHTHRPVFCSQTHIRYLRDRIDTLNQKIETDKNTENKLKKTLRKLNERLEKDIEDTLLPGMNKPAYSNTGCCSYRDGDITGIEISHVKGNRAYKGGIYLKLIKWSSKGDLIRPEVLRIGLLKEIFKNLSPDENQSIT